MCSNTERGKLRNAGRAVRTRRTFWPDLARNTRLTSWPPRAYRTCRAAIPRSAGRSVSPWLPRRTDWSLGTVDALGTVTTRRPLCAGGSGGGSDKGGTEHPAPGADQGSDKAGDDERAQGNHGAGSLSFGYRHPTALNPSRVSQSGAPARA